MQLEWGKKWARNIGKASILPVLRIGNVNISHAIAERIRRRSIVCFAIARYMCSVRSAAAIRILWKTESRIAVNACYRIFRKIMDMLRANILKYVNGWRETRIKNDSR